MVHFDFEFLLLILTVVSGVLWLVDAVFFARFRKAQAAAARKLPKEPLVIEYSRAFFPVLAIVLVLRAFAYEPFRIPSGSMMPTLLVGDFILVNKYTYGLRMPVWHGRITDGERPERGDVVVFRYPKDESQDYIKRVVGLPGDHISYYNHQLSINGKPVGMALDHKYQGLGDLNNMPNAGGCDRRGADCQVYIETMDDDTRYTVMSNPGAAMGVNGEVFVPNGHYFVMGDNRDHSNDSRLWGFVPEDNLVGKAVMVWMHWDWRSGGSGLDISRIGRKISN